MTTWDQDCPACICCQQNPGIRTARGPVGGRLRPRGAWRALVLRRCSASRKMRLAKRERPCAPLADRGHSTLHNGLMAPSCARSLGRQRTRDNTHSKARTRPHEWAGPCLDQKVEMAGIEPASKKFGQRYSTSLVGRLCSRGRGLVPTMPVFHQPMHLWPALSASCRPHPDLFYARSPALGQSEEADVIDLVDQWPILTSRLGGESVGRSKSVLGTFGFAPD